MSATKTLKKLSKEQSPIRNKKQNRLQKKLKKLPLQLLPTKKKSLKKFKKKWVQNLWKVKSWWFKRSLNL